MKTRRTLAIALLALIAAGCASDCGSSLEAPRPANQTSVLVTAAEGGEVKVGERGTLTIPPGALDEDTEITVAISAPAEGLAHAVVQGEVVTFGPAGLQFKEPAIFELATPVGSLEGPGAISRFNPNLGLWDEQGPTGSEYNPNLGLWDQGGDSGQDYNPNLGLWDEGDPDQMATGVRGFSSWAVTLPNHGVYSCGIDGDGGACCWGLREPSCTDCLPEPTPIPASTSFVQVSAGAWSDCGLTSAGTIECWGTNPPVPPSGAGFVDVATGRGHACGLKEDGTVTCFMAANLDYEVPSPSQGNVVDVTSGDFHSCARQSSGEVFCWGDDREGETAAPSGSDFVDIDAGAKHTCAVKTDGTLQCWGSELSGINAVPTRTDTAFVQVSVGVFAACALTDVGGVICWGADYDVVTGTPSGTGFTGVIARHRHACAVGGDGSLQCWGQDIEGSLAPPAGCGVPVGAEECEPGYVAVEGGCMNIDECAEGTDSCDANATCTDTPGSFECECDGGFTGDGDTCTDVDECGNGTDNCGTNATCTNTPGGFECACDAGYVGNGVTCSDEDECAAGTDNCDANAICTNSVGGFDCACDAGFTGDGVTCTDDDECAAATDNCDVNATCTNMPGGFDCMCDPGFAGDGLTCADEDECAAGTDNCAFNATCTNTVGSFTCLCDTGFSGDGVTCLDDDECALGTDSCDVNATCTNTPGSFACTCDAGYSGDGVTCTPVTVDGLSTGAEHNCAILSGEIWCWGDNLYGQLGDGSNVSSPAAVRVGAAANWVKLASGADHNCAINANGELWCWGSNLSGELGDGTTFDASAPVRESMNATNWVEVTAGSAHTCAVNAASEIFCWGGNFGGQLGDGTTTSQSVPVREASNGTTWTTVVAGGDHTCAIDGGASLWCWGANFAGQLGDDNPGVDNPNPTPTGQGPWDAVALGGAHTCATKFGELHCWGANLGGQLGVGDTSDRSFPTQVGVEVEWAIPSAGADNTCALKNDGTLWCWGANYEGQVGVGDTNDRPTPVQVGIATDWTAVEIPVIGAHTCGIQGGAVSCWGVNGSGQFGVPSSRLEPAGPVASGVVWSSVSAVGGEDVPFALGTSSYGCGIADGAPWCWGFSAYDLSVTGTAAQVAGTMGQTDWTSVSNSTTHSCGLRAGAPRCWGDNADGGLGEGTTSPSGSPIAVQGTATDMDWTVVSAGSGFSCGVKAGQLWCWGRGLEGQLGDGLLTSRSTPFESGASIGSSWTTVSAAHIHACGIHGGSLFCWGENFFGQLGNGTTSREAAIPVTPSAPGTTFVDVATSAEHTCAIDDTGGLWCTGDNASGEIGDGSMSTSLDFINVGAGQAPWSDVAVGRDHSCGVAGGNLYCWGLNEQGVLGDGTRMTSSTPVAVSTTFTDWVEVAVGDAFNCARRTTGDVHCWGDNSQGQMGDGSARALTPRSVPLP